MAQAVRAVVSGVEDGTLEVSDVTQQLLSSCLYTSASPNPELLIRTSGEVRLSDYMLWQVGTGDCKDVQFELAAHLKAKKFVFLITDTCFSVHNLLELNFAAVIKYKSDLYVCYHRQNVCYHRHKTFSRVCLRPV
jgi:hypothetical protein